MANLRIVLDEDVSHRLAGLLRSQGWDIDSAKELGRLRLTDAQVLLRAAEDRRTLVTHNINDFRLLHEAWVTWRRRWAAEIGRLTGSPVVLSQHAGILITPHLGDRDLARILEKFAETDEPLADRLFVWSRGRQWEEVHLLP